MILIDVPNTLDLTLAHISLQLIGLAVLIHKWRICHLDCLNLENTVLTILNVVDHLALPDAFAMKPLGLLRKVLVASYSKVVDLELDLV